MVRPLAPSPSLENLKKQCKELLRAQRRHDPSVCVVLRQLARFRNASDARILGAKLALHDAQHAVSMEYGFANWRDLKAHVEASRRASPPDASDDVQLLHDALKRDGRVLAVDIGAGCVKVAEFGRCTTGEFRVTGVGVRGRDVGATSLQRALEALSADGPPQPCRCLACLSPETAFIRFVRLPRDISQDQLREEESRNAPFAPEETACAWHMLNSPGRKDAEFMFVAVRRETLDRAVRALRGAGLEPIAVETAPTAGRNAASAAGIGLTQLELLLDIGASSATLLFCAPDRFYVRRMPIRGSAMKEDVAAGIDRLTAEVLRSMQVFREHVKDEFPAALHLTGGGSILPGVGEGLSGQLQLPVQRLVPFAAMEVTSTVEEEPFDAVSHLFGNTAGLISRFIVDRPLAMNLLDS